MSDQLHQKLTNEQRKELMEEENARQAQEDGLNDARAEQEMIEGAVDTHESFTAIERHRSLEQDEPGSDLNGLDPVPPK